MFYQQRPISPLVHAIFSKMTVGKVKNQIPLFLHPSYSWRFKQKLEVLRMANAQIGDIYFILEGSEHNPLFTVAVYTQPFNIDADVRPSPAWKFYDISLREIVTKYKSHPHHILMAFIHVLHWDVDMTLTTVHTHYIMDDIRRLKENEPGLYREFLEEIIRFKSDIFFIMRDLQRRNPLLRQTIASNCRVSWFIKDLLEYIFKDTLIIMGDKEQPANEDHPIVRIACGGKSKVELMQDNHDAILREPGVLGIISSALCDDDMSNLYAARRCGADAFHVDLSGGDNSYFNEILQKYLGRQASTKHLPRSIHQRVSTWHHHDSIYRQNREIAFLQHDERAKQSSIEHLQKAMEVSKSVIEPYICRMQSSNDSTSDEDWIDPNLYLRNFNEREDESIISTGSIGSSLQL